MIAHSTSSRALRMAGASLAVLTVGVGLGLTASGSIAAPSKVAPTAVKPLFQAQAQPQSTLDRLAEALDGESLLVLTTLVSITGLTGSGILSIGLWHKLFTPDQVWAAAHVDEDFQISQWGQDEEAAERRAMRRVEFDTAVAVLDALRA